VNIQDQELKRDNMEPRGHNDYTGPSAKTELVRTKSTDGIIQVIEDSQYYTGPRRQTRLHR
jgi:hypothetical protein